MGSLNLFLKENKKERENVRYAATKSLCGEDGKPLEWLIKPLTSKENEEIRESCMRYVQAGSGKKTYRPELDTSRFIAKRIAASVVEPDLYNARLQDSYGVKTPEDLLMAMVDNPREYYEFGAFIEALNGTAGFAEKVEAAKN